MKTNWIERLVEAILNTNAGKAVIDRHVKAALDKVDVDEYLEVERVVTDAVTEAIDEADIDREVERMVESAVEEYMDGYNFEDKVKEAISDVDMEEMVEDAVKEELETLRSKLSDLSCAIGEAANSL